MCHLEIPGLSVDCFLFVSRPNFCVKFQVIGSIGSSVYKKRSTRPNDPAKRDVYCIVQRKQTGIIPVQASMRVPQQHSLIFQPVLYRITCV